MSEQEDIHRQQSSNCTIIFSICDSLYGICIGSTWRHIHAAKRRAVADVVLVPDIWLSRLYTRRWRELRKDRRAVLHVCFHLSWRDAGPYRRTHSGCRTSGRGGTDKRKNQWAEHLVMAQGNRYNQIAGPLYTGTPQSVAQVALLLPVSRVERICGLWSFDSDQCGSPDGLIYWKYFSNNIYIIVFFIYIWCMIWKKI